MQLNIQMDFFYTKKMTLDCDLINRCLYINSCFYSCNKNKTVQYIVCFLLFTNSQVAIEECLKWVLMIRRRSKWYSHAQYFAFFWFDRFDCMCELGLNSIAVRSTLTSSQHSVLFTHVHCRHIDCQYIACMSVVTNIVTFFVYIKNIVFVFRMP